MSCGSAEPIVLKICLAGNPNVGKSVIFNQLTGSSQVVGNWPGKTVKKAEGAAKFRNYNFRIVDLPGIYNLSAYSLEEIISREFIVGEKPDFIINVIDSNQLERNLFFTLQLLLLNVPVIISLNQYDILMKRGYQIDTTKLSEFLGVPVIPTVAVHNRGVHELLERIIETYEKEDKITKKNFQLGKEIESTLTELISAFKVNFPHNDCPLRFAAIKILENDEKCIEGLKLDGKNGEELLHQAEEGREKLESLHGEQISTLINVEFYKIINDITQKVVVVKKISRKKKWSDTVDHLTVHSIWGYFILILILFGTYFLVFQFGNWFSGLLDGLFVRWSFGAATMLGGADSILYKILWNGLFGGLIGGVGGVLPFVLPFFIIIEILQDIGYLPRAAYLMDRFMHRIGVHGKTIIPIILGLGCNVPAVSACAILDTEKERKRGILISSMVPCSAVTTIVLGLVAKYLGIGYAFVLYAVNFIVLIGFGKTMTILDKFKDSELIIELHDFRVPNFKVIAKQTWHRSKDFVIIAIPLIVVLGAIMQILIEFNLLNVFNTIFSPITLFLGLPLGVGAFFFYGIFRKELNLVLLENFVVVTLGMSMTEYFTPIQMMIFTLVTMLYVPCLATIITIGKEVGWKFTILVFFIEITTAVVIGGMIRWIFEIFNLFSTLSELAVITITFGVFFFLILIILVTLNIYRRKQQEKQVFGKQFVELKDATKSCSECKGCSEPQK